MTTPVQSTSNTSYTQASNTTQSSAGSIDKDEFLKLLTYQLKMQDPLKPYDNQEFAAQLAQFSQLEQLTDIKSLLSEQISSNQLLTKTISNTALPGLLGKNAKAISDGISFDGETPVDLGYSLPYPAASGSISIKDVSGKVVNTLNITDTNLTTGDHKLSWNGTDSNGDALPAGKYTFSVSGTDANGSTFSADTYMFGKIQGIRFKSEGTVIVMGGLEIPLENLSDVTTDN
jgi:flagellar basal-body rod modification protein FlgD